MKFPPKFALAILPVTLVHLVAIAMLGVVIRRDENNREEVVDSSFASNDIEIPGYHQLGAGTKVAGGVDSALFPESRSSVQVELPTYAPVADPEPIASDIVESEAATIFPFEEAAMKRGHAESPSGQEKSQQAVDAKAKPRISSEPAPGIREFRPINAKKAS